MAHSRADIEAAVQRNCERLLLDPDYKRPKKSAAEFVLKRLLNELIWKLSEADDNGRIGKYVRCDTWSLAAQSAYKGSSNGKFVFEHVVPRRVIVEKLLVADSSSKIKEALGWIRTCVVLKEEDDRLRENDTGTKRKRTFDSPDGWWERYKECGIELVKFEKEREQKLVERGDSETNEGSIIE